MQANIEGGARLKLETAVATIAKFPNSLLIVIMVTVAARRRIARLWLSARFVSSCGPVFSETEADFSDNAI